MRNTSQRPKTLVPERLDRLDLNHLRTFRDGGWIDQGAAGPQFDGGFATLDGKRRPRVVGSGADMGALEKQ